MSDSWHQWRLKGLGSSDAPIVMGVSPWMTMHALWELKVGLKSRETQSNWAMQRGHQLEPKARAIYELYTGTEMPPCNLEHPEYPFLRASLDGYDGQAVIEIKCPKAADHLLAVGNMVPPKYMPQVQHQLFVSGAAYCDYVSYDGLGSCIVVVRVVPHEVYLRQLVARLMVFWECVLTRTPPALDLPPVPSPDDCVVAR